MNYFFEINFGSIFIELKYSYIFWLHYSENSRPKIEEIMLKKKKPRFTFFSSCITLHKYPFDIADQIKVVMVILIVKLLGLKGVCDHQWNYIIMLHVYLKLQSGLSNS